MAALQIRSYPERVVNWIPLPNWLTLLLLWEALFLADYIITIATKATQQHLAEYAFLVLFFAMVSISIVYCSDVLKRLYSDLILFIEVNESELKHWYERKLSLSYQGLFPILFGLAFMLAVNFTVGPSIRSFTTPDNPIYYLRFTYELAGFFILGVGIWALITVMLIPISITGFKIKVSVNQISGRGLQALGTAYFKMSLAITITFVPLVIAAILSPLIEDTSILIWLAAGTLVIFGFFIIPQIGIHKIMAHEKHQRLLSFSDHLEDALERSLKEPTSENMQRLKDLFELQTHLKNMNEWPFDLNTVWQLITALLIPIGLAVLEVFF